MNTTVETTAEGFLAASPENLLDFAATYPAGTPGLMVRVEKAFGISQVRYFQLLARAARSVEGIAHAPITARRIRERAERASRHRVALLR